MSHDTPTVAAQKRERTGSRFSKRLRKQGRLPAVVYGHQIDPIAVSVDEKEMLTLLRHGVHVVNLDIQGAGTETCLVKDLQFGYLGDNVIHLDFTRVDLAEEVEVNVHIEFVGVPKAALQAGSILEHDQTELSVRCRVSDIPESIKVDLERMEGTQLHASEVDLPAGLALAMDADALIASVHASRVADETAEEAEVAVEAEPEVITEARDEGAGES
jgi:large subunit ribosomal protein L25